MKKIRDWIREQRRLRAFLREHKDEYYVVAIPASIELIVSASVLALLAFTLGFVSTPIIAPLWHIILVALIVCFVVYHILLIINGKKVQKEIKRLKMQYHYTTNR